MKLIGIIDVGSNSIRLSCYEINNPDFKIIHSITYVKELVSYVHDRILSEDGIKMLDATIKDLVNQANEHNVQDVYAYVTAPHRKIDNPELFTEIITRYCKCKLVTGEEEAHYSFNGAIYEMDMKEGCLIDIGGGSTELCQFKDNKILNKYSIPVGCVMMSLAKEDILTKELEILDYPYTGPFLGSGGTIESLFLILEKHYQIKDKCNINNIYTLINEYNNDHVQQLIEQYVYARKTTLYFGLKVLTQVMEYLNIHELIVSKHTIKEGYLLELLNNN